MDNLLGLLKQNARLSIKELSVLLNQSEEVVVKALEAYEKQGIIKGYQAILNYEKLEPAPVFALIELKVQPKKEFGFQEIADRVMAFEEVDSVYLMAGDYDLAIFVRGKTIQDVAMFVAKRLSTLDSVLSTATHFVLTKYKEDGFILRDEEADELRGQLVV
ncbi:MAG: Lrp/AsnC family transcriptional regulator [Erysipelotrichaceae bacterium]